MFFIKKEARKASIERAQYLLLFYAIHSLRRGIDMQDDLTSEIMISSNCY